MYNSYVLRIDREHYICDGAKVKQTVLVSTRGSTLGSKVDALLTDIMSNEYMKVKYA